MILSLLFFAMSVTASIPNLDYVSTVLIGTGQTQFMQITSNPSTGYWWVISKTHSEKLLISDYDGEYVPSSDVAGSSGTQLFKLTCSNSCTEGEEFSLHLSLKRSWESTGIDEKTIKIQVTNEPRIQ